jgi:hypothetical protein
VTADLVGVISPEGLAAARELAGKTRGIIKETEDLDAALEKGVPLIGNVRKRQASARADLRRAYFTLQPQTQPE